MMETPKRKATTVDGMIGLLLREKRHAAGLSQSSLGAAIGVTFQQIQKYEAGTNRIAVSTMIRIAQSLGVPPDAFVAEIVSRIDA